MADTDLVTTDQAPGQGAPEFTRSDLELVDDPVSSDASASSILPQSDIERELKELPTLRSEKPSEYWKEPTQARERDLIEMRDVWHEAEQTSQAVSAQVDKIIEALPEDETAAFESGFTEIWDSLPENAQAVIQHELSSRADPVRPASQVDIDRFCTMPEGKELVQEWRGRAGMKIAALQERMERLAGAGDELGEWFDELPEAQARAVMRALAG